jgi:hypothetical protein
MQDSSKESNTTTKRFSCDECNRTYAYLGSVYRHKRKVHNAALRKHGPPVIFMPEEKDQKKRHRIRERLFYAANRDTISEKRKAKRAALNAIKILQGDCRDVEKRIAELRKEIVEEALYHEEYSDEITWLFGCALLGVDPYTEESLLPIWDLGKRTTLAAAQEQSISEEQRQLLKSHIAAKYVTAQALVNRCKAINVSQFRALCQAYAYLHPEFAPSSYKRHPVLLHAFKDRDHAPGLAKSEHDVSKASKSV